MPSASAKLNITSAPNLRPWLKELVKTSNMGDDFDPVLRPIKTPDGYVNEDGTPYKEFDYMSTIPSYAALSGIGDPRMNLGYLVSAVFKRYLPQVLLYNEVTETGGCQIIENYICDADGIPLKEVTTVCPSGVKLEIIDPLELQQFIRQTYDYYINKDVTAFVDFIKKTYPSGSGYFLSARTLKDVPLFWITASNGNQEYHYKYPIQNSQEVAKLLNLALQDTDPSVLTPEMVKSLTTPSIVYNKDFTI